MSPVAAIEPKRTHAGSPAVALWTVALVALAARAMFVRLYGPVVEGDALTYLRIGRLLASGHIDAYDGAAPPLYGAFLQCLGGAPGLVQGVQSLLGAGVAVLTAWLVWRPTRSIRWAILAGLGYALALDTLCFEAYLVTETLATLWTTLAVAVLVLATERDRPSLAHAFALSLVTALGALTKPFLLFVFPIAIVVLGWRWRRHGRALAPSAIAFVTPALLLVGGWCWHNGVTQGVWGPSTMTGYRMSQHVGSVMEDAPERYAVIRDIFVRHRDEFIARHGTAINTIWAAIPDMERATGLSYGRLSIEVSAMSWAVARRHPGVWLRSVGEAWALFWSRPMYLKPFYAHGARAAVMLGWLARLERPLAVLANALFLALALAALAWPAARRLLGSATAWLGVLVIGTGSLAQALAEHSDNGRFAVPFVPLIGVVLALAGWRLAGAWVPSRGRAHVS